MDNSISNVQLAMCNDSQPRKMKYSGVEWIGDIPQSYIPYRLKNILVKGKDSIRVGPFGSALKGSDILSEGDYWVYNQRVVLDSSFESNNTFINKEKYEELYSFRIEAGDVLCTTRGSIGKITRVPENYIEGVIHPCIIRFRINDSIVNYKLLELIFNYSDIVIGQLKTASNTTTIDVVYSDSLKNVMIPLGTIKQQDELLQYLTSKCTQIDALIANEEQQKAKLKAYKQSFITETVTKGINPNVTMKDSGVEWIGEIPEHWRIIRKLSYITSEGISYGIVKLLDPDDVNGVKVLRCSDVLEGYICPDNIRTVTTEVSNEYTRTILSGGEVLVNVRGSLGGCSVVPKEMAGYNIAREVAKIALDSSVYNRYIMYYLLSHCFVDYRTRHLLGSVYVGLNIELLSSCPIPCPSLKEQKEIVDYIDGRCKKIDQLIALKKQKIETLQQYKKSLIYEYVTGKKEV